MYDSRNWLTGMTDGEGSFIISVRREIVKYRYGKINPNYTRVNFNFTIALRKDDLACLLKIQELLGGCGQIYHSSPKTIGQRNPHPISQFSVRGTKQCWKYIVPHFNNYPLQSKKKGDFQIWKQAVEIVYNKAMRPKKGVNFRKTKGGLWLPGELEEVKRLNELLKSSRLYREPSIN